MFEAIIYFAGPMSTWGGKPAELEIIARLPSRFRILARARAVAIHSRLNMGRCGWFINDEQGQAIEHVRATAPTTTGASA
jgi:hypothetical protein